MHGHETGIVPCRSDFIDTMTSRLAILDLETTGADPRQDRITEIGIVVVEDGALVEEYSTLVNPGRSIPAGIETLTGISQAMVERAPSFADLALEVAGRLNGRTLVAHNARFDYAFLRNEFRRAGLPFRSDVMCSVRLSRRLFPEHPRHNLDSLIERFDLCCDARHRALPDARLVHQLLEALYARLGRETVNAAMRETIDGLRAPPGVDPDMLDDIPETPGVYCLSDAQGHALYAGKAANLRAQVLTHFAERSAHAAVHREAIQAGRLEWEATAGELSAALRQRLLIAQREPLHNRTPGRSSEAWAWRWNVDLAADAPLVLEGLDGVSSEAFADLCGPFRSRGDAMKALRGLAREHRLCESLIGLAPHRSPCPGHPAGHCRGACAGEEPRTLHRMRLLQALSRLRLPAWPFDGPVALIERDRDDARCEVLLLDAWRHLSSARTPAELEALLAASPSLPPFDVDVFRLLRRALDKVDTQRIVALSDRQRVQHCFA